MWIFAVILFVTAAFVAGVTRWFFVLFGVLILASYLFPGDKPTEFDADVWVADNEERAANLKRKTRSWRAGRIHPAIVATIEADCAATGVEPAAPAGFAPVSAATTMTNPVRRHPMRPAAGK